MLHKYEQIRSARWIVNMYDNLLVSPPNHPSERSQISRWGPMPSAETLRGTENQSRVMIFTCLFSVRTTRKNAPRSPISQLRARISTIETSKLGQTLDIVVIHYYLRGHNTTLFLCFPPLFPKQLFYSLSHLPGVLLPLLSLGRTSRSYDQQPAIHSPRLVALTG